jgi:hypothetical protein
VSYAMEQGQQGSKNPAARAWLAVRIAIVVLGGYGGTLVVSPDAASVDTSKPATRGRLKTGHHEVAPETGI